ncbi:hypothetical protein [Tengunoibacter tsumagoiensis]|uniref:Uncharacterized protein n=1 Tax=Tengunoibacter tsumagoiensis TaxID=2014871 RepID=A0A402A4F0_9CHLR|nr:hypothetical protein [Tengunoibacter tsumagoiensis]GCE13949.1 hypothetical protein KTT_38080 [Tengunoibacter tsumagoiensis]
MIYYRVAFRIAQPQPVQVGTTEQVLTNEPAWKWRSTILTSPHALNTLLKAYHAIPQENIRIFFASSEDGMDDMLKRLNQGQVSASLTAEQFLAQKKINTQVVRWMECELSTAADHDQPYIFAFPTTIQEQQSWFELARRVHTGELEP